MAMIDYGAVVIKNGVVINSNQFFMDMKESVGWEDIPAKLYDDCDCMFQKWSNCGECARATKEGYDCRGNRLMLSEYRGQYYSYAGDEHFMVCTYKHNIAVVVDKEKVFEISPCYGHWWSYGKVVDECHKSKYYTVGEVTIRLREVVDCVSLASFKYKGDFYNIVFGYGIDPTKKVWDAIKVQYLGKKRARKVDNVYKRLITEWEE